MLLVWAAALWNFGPRLLVLVVSADTILGMVVFGAVSLMLVLFWLASAYVLCTVIFSFTSPHCVHRNTKFKNSSIALLYTTCDDFQVQAASSCIKQDYPNYRVFILDDSTNEDIRREVDLFCESHRETTTLVRRGTNNRFKAGNINYALGTVASDYELFALADADEYLPPEFLRVACQHLQCTDVAFAQANHVPNPAQPSRFASDLAPTIRALWDVFFRSKNRFGFVACLGHGALVRKSAWDLVGGFPEVVTEDYAFSAALAVCGQRGVYMPNLICGEDFPPNYAAFKRRQEKYIVGSAQSMLRYGWRLLGASRLSLVEKVDFFLWSVPLHIPALCLVYLVASLLGAAIASSHWRMTAIEFGGFSWVSPPMFLGSRPVGVPLDWDFQVFSAACSVTPALACLVVSIRHERRFFRLLAASMVPYLSVMVAACRGILRLVFTGVAHFIPTGRRAVGSETVKGRASRSLRILEILLGVVLSVASVAWLNAGLFGISCSIWIGTYIEAFGWQTRTSRQLCFVAFACVLLQCVLILGQPLFSLLTFAHFTTPLGQLHP
jgi:cellulose synthase/poly-beta-1,6-N-acetylglucosamine synthase-like glycosyltransferase